jgi:cold shock CspA family protein
MRIFSVVLSLLVALVAVVPVVDAQTQTSRTVTGTVTLVNEDSQVVRIQPDGGGQDLPIIVKGLDDSTWRSLKKGDRVTARVHDTNKGRFVQAESIRLARGAATGGDWQRIHGVVQNVQGSTLTLRTDDGRRLTVDMTQVGREIRQALQPGEGVTVIGHEFTGANRLRAQYIQQDSSAGVQGSASPSASPSTSSVDEKWQRIHGKVESVSGSTLRVRADDGRALTVDMSEVNPAVQKALTPGERVTVVGFYKGDQNNVNAKFIQQDSSAR